MKKRMKRGGTAKKKRAKAMGGGMMKKRMKLGGSAQTTKKPGRKSKKMVDLSGDGKITKKDILIGRGVIKKPAVTGKVKNGSAAAKRRKSYCARSLGQLKRSSAKTKNDPNSRIRQARRRWKC